MWLLPDVVPVCSAHIARAGSAEHAGKMIEWLMGWATAETARQSAMPALGDVQLSADPTQKAPVFGLKNTPGLTLQYSIPAKKRRSALLKLMTHAGLGLRQCSAAPAS